MKITFRNPKHPDIYAPFIENDCTDVEITEAFSGPIFKTEDGEYLAVCMRESGFELVYWTDTEAKQDISLNLGEVDVRYREKPHTDRDRIRQILKELTEEDIAGKPGTYCAPLVQPKEQDPEDIPEDWYHGGVTEKLTYWTDPMGCSTDEPCIHPGDGVPCDESETPKTDAENIAEMVEQAGVVVKKFKEVFKF